MSQTPILKKSIAIGYINKTLDMSEKLYVNIRDKLEIKFLPIIMGYFSDLVLTISLIGLINIYDFFCNLLFCKIFTIYFI